MELNNVRLLQVWQYAAQAERSLDQVVATARRYGFTGVLVKAIDGLTWMGDVRAERPHADALHSVEQAWAQRAQVNAAGLQYCLWTVPLWREDRIAQARLSAELTGACDALFLDVEPYPEFGGANQPVGDAAAFMSTLRSIAPLATVVLQPDPRPARMNEIRAAEWLPHCNGLAGQHYWDTFATDDPAAQMQQAIESAKRFNVTAIPTLPLASSPELLQEAIATLRQAGVTSWCAWRLGVGSEASLAVAGGGGAARLAGAGAVAALPAPTLDRTLTRTTIADVLGGWRGRLAAGPLSPTEAAQAAFEIRSAADAIERGEAS